MPSNNPDISYFAQTNFRNEKKLFGIQQKDRMFHVYALGQTGVGKSTMLATLMKQDIIHQRGFALIEPHSDLVNTILKSIPESEQHRLIYLDATDPSLTLGYNPIKRVSFEKRALVASGILDVLKKLWKDAWGMKLEHILRYTLLALLDQPKAHLGNILDMLLDKHYRRGAINYIQSETVKTYWLREFPKYMPYDVLPVLNKIGAFLAYPTVKRILMDNAESISLRKIMDDGNILLINLSKGHLGADVSHILGALLVTSLTSAAYSRVDIPEEERRPFHIFLDEFQNYSTLSLIDGLSELRKFKVSLCLAHQFTKQIDIDVLNSVIGNVGSKILFRCGHTDASLWSKEMKPYFEDVDFMRLPNREIYLSLMINGKPSKPFSARTVLVDPMRYSS